MAVVDQGQIDQYSKLFGNIGDFTEADLKKLNSADWMKSLYPSGKVTAQNAEYVLGKLQPMLEAVTTQYNQLQSQYSAINPQLNPENYLIKASDIVDAYSGIQTGYAARQAPATKVRQQIVDMMNAIEQATKAKTAFESGKPLPPAQNRLAYLSQQYSYDYPGGDLQTRLSEVDRAKNNASKQSLAALFKSVISGQAVPELSEEFKAAANANAAYVGAALPYPTSSVGQIRDGGVISNQQIENALARGFDANKAIDMAKNNNYATLDTPPVQPVNQQNPSGTNNTTPNGTNTTSGGVSGGGSGTGSTTNPYNDPAAQANSMAILNKYLNDGTIDSGTYQFFKAAVEAWNPEQQIDYANILNTFENIKNTDINPYFKEQADLFINDLQTNRQYLQDTRAFEVQQEGENRARLKENMQKDLQARGLLFSGEAVKQLGEEGAYAVAGTPQANQSATPTIQPFGQGELQKQSTAAVTSNSLRYEKSLKDLAQQAEAYLGTTGSAGLIPGVQQIGGITGTLENEKKSAQASALSNLYNQQQQNVAAQEPIKVFNE